jgi:hypothetical protein
MVLVYCSTCCIRRKVLFPKTRGTGDSTIKKRCSRSKVKVIAVLYKTYYRYSIYTTLIPSHEDPGRLSRIPETNFSILDPESRVKKIPASGSRSALKFKYF